MNFIIKGSITKKDLIKKVNEAPYMTPVRLDIAITCIKEGRYEVDKNPGIVVDESQYGNVKHKEMGLSELIIKLSKEDKKRLDETKHSSNKKTMDSMG